MSRVSAAGRQPEAQNSEERPPLCVATWHQTHMDEPIRFFGRDEWTRPGKGYIVGRMEKGGPIVALAGPFWSDFQLAEALSGIELQPMQQDAGRKRGRKRAKVADYEYRTEPTRRVAMAAEGEA